MLFGVKPHEVSSSSLVFSLLPAYHGGMWRGGLNKYQSTAPDCLQRPLVPRSHFRQQVSASVSALAARGKNQKSLQRTGCTMLTLYSEGYKGSQENEHRKPMSV